MIEAIHHNGCPYIELIDLWQALYILFNTTQNCQIDLDFLEEFESKPVKKWGPFLEEEFISVITKCNNLFTPELDKVL